MTVNSDKKAKEVLDDVTWNYHFGDRDPLQYNCIGPHTEGLQYMLAALEHC